MKLLLDENLAPRLVRELASLFPGFADYVAHYHGERPHQGIGNERIDAPSVTVRVDPARVAVDERQGGLLKSYRVAA